MTQQQLAELIGVGQGKISLWKNGVNLPEAPNIAALAVALDVAADEVVKGLAVKKGGQIIVVRTRPPIRGKRTA